MMLQVGDDGVVSSVNEEDLIYVDKNELEQFVESYHKLEKENEQLKEERNYFERKKCEYFNKYNKKHLDNIQLKEENEHLKQRNENQYNQLNELWKLIEAKDWETLTAMDNQMKEDEERLQREWKCYE